MKAAKTEKDFKGASEIFKTIPGWRDADKLAAESVVSASFEEPFGRHAELEPLRISAGDGEVYVEGKIDRADIINVR